MDSYNSELNGKISADEAKYLRTFGKWFFRIGIAVIAAIITVLASVLLRLSFAPIDLNFVRPYIQEEIKQSQLDFDIQFGDVQMVWERWLRPYEIVIKDVHITDASTDGDVLSISEIGLSLWIERLIAGEFELRNIFIYSPKLTLNRKEDSGFGIKFTDEPSSDSEFSPEEILPLLILGQGKKELGSLSNLNKIVISDSQVILQDDIAKELWTLPKTTFTLNRYEDGFRMRARMKPDKPGLFIGHLEIELKHILGSSRADLAFDFKKVNFAELLQTNKKLFDDDSKPETDIEKALEFLHEFNFPLQGRLQLAFVPKTGQFIEGAASLKGGTGTFTFGEIKIPIEDLQFHAEIDHSLINIDLLQATLAGAKVSLKGNHHSGEQPLFIHKWLEPGNKVTAKTEISDVDLASLLTLWPKDLAPNAREWVADEIKSASIPNLEVDFGGYVDETGTFISSRTEGAFLIDDLKLNYLDGLPHAENVSARANFDQTGFEIELKEGNILGITLTDGIVKITGLDKDDEQLSLSLNLSGKLSDILRIIDSEPLPFARKAKIDPATTQGQGQMLLKMSFPLVNDLEFSQMKLNIDGEFEDIATAVNIDLHPLHATNGNLTVKVDQNHFEASGKADINKLPSTIKAFVHFDDKQAKPWSTQISVSNIMTANDFKNYGYDYTEYVSGKAKTTFIFETYPKSNSSLGINLGLHNMKVDVPQIGWLKPIGKDASFGFQLVLDNNGVSEIRDINLRSDYIKAKGKADFNEKGKIHGIHLTSVESKGTEAAMSVVFTDQGGYDFHFSGKQINAEPFMNYLHDDTKNSEKKRTYPIHITSNVDILQMREGAQFRNVDSAVDLLIQPTGVQWLKVELNAAAGSGTSSNGRMAKQAGGISLDLEPNSTGGQNLKIHANDAGQLFKNLEIYDKVLGGSMVINASRQGEGPFKGTLELDNFDATEIPLVGRLVSALSPVGLVNIFSSEGRVAIDSFNCNFTYSDSEVSFTQGVGKSIGVGFTAEGKIDKANKTFDIKGNIIPAYVINSILENIPLIGSLLTGGKGEGLFAIAYTIKDTTDNPTITINPLTALAPGFIRNLFDDL